MITSQGAKRRSANALLQIGCLDFQKRSHLALLKRNSHVWTDWRLAPDLVHLSSLMLPSMTGRLAPLRKCLAPLMIRLARGRRGAKLPQDLQTSKASKEILGRNSPPELCAISWPRKYTNTANSKKSSSSGGTRSAGDKKDAKKRLQAAALATIWC